MPRGKVRWSVIVGLVCIVLAAGLRYGDTSGGRLVPRADAILVIAPYWYNGTWVFDDEAAGLNREPFVAGVPEMIDVLVKDIPEAKERISFAVRREPVPGYQKKLTWGCGDMGGNYYRLDNPPMEGWICPAMFRYYRDSTNGALRQGRGRYQVTFQGSEMMLRVPPRPRWPR